MASRVEFNREAKQLRADDNLPALKARAVELVGSPRNEDLRQTLHADAVAAVVDWWPNPDEESLHEKVTAAAKNAARNFRGEGGYRNDNVWRGGYDSHTRKHGSQIMAGDVDTNDPKKRAKLAELEVELRHNLAAEFDGPIAEDEPDQGARASDHARERAAEQRAEVRGYDGKANIASGAAVLEAGAERTTHDGPHMDDVRLNPRDDGEGRRGVEGATRGLHTGRMVPPAHVLAWLRALAERPEADSDAKFLAAIDKAGGIANYSNKDESRRTNRVRDGLRHKHINRELKERATAIREAVGDTELQAAWLSAQPIGEQRGYRAKGDHGKYRAEQVPVPPPGGVSGIGGGVLSAAWPTGEQGRKRLGAKHYGPEWVGPYEMFRVDGLDSGDQAENVKAWRKVEALYRRMGWGQAISVNSAEGVVTLIHVWPPDGGDV